MPSRSTQNPDAGCVLLSLFFCLFCATIASTMFLAAPPTEWMAANKTGEFTPRQLTFGCGLYGLLILSILVWKVGVSIGKFNDPAAGSTGCSWLFLFLCMPHFLLAAVLTLLVVGGTRWLGRFATAICCAAIITVSAHPTLQVMASREIDRLLKVEVDQSDTELVNFESHWHDWTHVDEAELMSLPLNDETKQEVQLRRDKLRELLTTSPVLDKSEHAHIELTLKQAREELGLLQSKLNVVEAFRESPRTFDQFMEQARGAVTPSSNTAFIRRHLALVLRDWLAEKLPEKDPGLDDEIRQTLHKTDGLVIGKFGALEGEVAPYYRFYGKSPGYKQIYPSELKSSPQTPSHQVASKSYNVERRKLLVNIDDRTAWVSFKTHCEDLDKSLLDVETARRAPYSLPVDSDLLGMGREELEFAADAELATSILKNWDEVSRYFESERSQP